MTSSSIVAAAFSLAISLNAYGQSGRLLLCGGPQVLLGTVKESGGKLAFVSEWIWRPETSAGLPVPLMRKFVTTDDCKPVSGGKEILITSSGDAVALVSRETGNTLFYAKVKNAHSAALLPGGLIAVASSDSSDGSGDRLLLFDRTQSDKVQAQLSLEAAHGVEWDQKRNILWSLGSTKLLEIAVRKPDGGPAKMEVLNSTNLPTTIGHDLQESTDCSTLFVSTTKEVFIFDPDQRKFSPFPPFAGLREIKSLSINRKTGQIAFIQASSGVWWTYSLRFLNPAAEVRLESHVYKARWYSEE